MYISHVCSSSAFKILITFFVGHRDWLFFLSGDFLSLWLQGKESQDNSEDVFLDCYL